MLLDPQVLRQSCGDDEEFARELFGEYHGRVLEILSGARSAWQEGRHDDIRKVAHELKGSSLTLGAVEMANLSRSLEDKIKAGQTDDIPTCLDQLEQQSKLLFDHLKGLSYL